MEDHKAVLVVPAKAYDQALAFVNSRRKESGLEPIKGLPAGFPLVPNSCPCARACGRSISVFKNYWRDYSACYSGAGRDHDAPLDFVAFFDKYAPEHTLTLPVRGD